MLLLLLLLRHEPHIGRPAAACHLHRDGVARVRAASDGWAQHLAAGPHVPVARAEGDGIADFADFDLDQLASIAQSGCALSVDDSES